jgi:hypothetical protein
MSSEPTTYCIIGGGPAGIGLGKCLAQRRLEFEILEQEDDFGGVWNFGRASGRVYESAHLISSKRNTQFSDHPMPDDYPPYPGHRLFLRYIRDLARRFKLYERARFGARVVRVEPDGPNWRVSCDGREDRVYRGVFVANGLQRNPNIPSYPGRFDGRMLHSSEYRNADIFRGQRVLVVGGGNSGCDIAVDAVHGGATSVVHSMRRPYYFMPKFIDGQPTQDWLMELPRRFSDRNALWAHVMHVLKLAGYHAPDYGLEAPDYEIDQAHPVMNSQVLYHIGHGDIVAKPDVRAFAGRTVEFSDGSTADCDLAVFATGYGISFPFLAPEHLGWTKSRPDLFLSTFHRLHERLCFVGQVNAAGGFGNVMNALGRMLAAYVEAAEAKTRSFRIFRQMMRGPEPDLGRSRFISSPRHDFEVDLWRFVTTLNFYRTMLES